MKTTPVFSRRRFLSGTVLGAITLLAGCSGGSDSGSASSSSPSSGQRESTTSDSNSGAAQGTINKEVTKEEFEMWYDSHKNTFENGFSRFNNANDLYSEEEYNRALVDFQKASEDFDELESDTQELINEYSEDTPRGKLYRQLYWLFQDMSEAAASGYLAASSMNDGDSAGGSDNYATLQTRLELANDHLAELDEITGLKEGDL